MTKELLALPVILTFVLGVATQLEAVANQASQQAIDFSQDMSNAMACATHGVPIRECSPDLFSQDFDSTISEFQGVLGELNSSINATTEVEGSFLN